MKENPKLKSYFSKKKNEGEKRGRNKLQKILRSGFADKKHCADNLHCKQLLPETAVVHSEGLHSK
jgi:hypothetical protein